MDHLLKLLKLPTQISQTNNSGSLKRKAVGLEWLTDGQTAWLTDWRGRLNAPANDDEHDGHKAANLSVKHFRNNKNNKFKP